MPRPLPQTLTRLTPTALFFAIASAGCHTPSTDSTSLPALPSANADRSAGAFVQTDPWLLTTTDPNANRGNHGIFLGNGIWGATFGPNGGPSKDSVAFIAGNYDKAENLAPLDNWQDSGLPIAKPGEPYSQTLDMRHGVLTTKMGAVTVISFASVTPPLLSIVNVAGEKPRATPSPTPRHAVITDGPGRLRPPHGRVTVTLPQTYPPINPVTLDFKEDERDGSRSYFWFAHMPSDSNSEKSTFWTSEPLNKNLQAVQEAAWAKQWQSADIQIDGDPEAQQLVHKLMFDLLQSTRPGASDSIPPESLSGNFYKGHIFWDAEVWMFPAFLAQYPDYAKSILDYRFKHLTQAKALAASEHCQGADFPWESASSGKEVAPGGFSEGRHVTAGVGWAAWQYYLATQDKSYLKSEGWPLLSAIADYWSTRATLDPADGKYHIRKVFGPDELRGEVDDNTYTNAMARYCLNAAVSAAGIAGQPANPKWGTVASKLALPLDAAKHRYLARAKDKGEATKQADGELVLYPAELPMDKQTADATFDFEAARPIKNGPAMTASIHALIAARLGRAAEADRDFRDSYRPFIRGPFLLLSEKRSLDRCVFTTGAGGILQSVLYGFGGIDWNHWDQMTKSPICLPPTWKKLTITGVQHAGKRYTVTVTPQGRTVTAD